METKISIIFLTPKTELKLQMDHYYDTYGFEEENVDLMLATVVDPEYKRLNYLIPKKPK